MYETKCPECNGRIQLTDSEEYCTKCGLVIDENIDFDETVDTNQTLTSCLPTLWID